MSEHKYEIKRKIRNVIEWLNSAEDNFQQDHEVKGQLNLMMAQAEMQTIQKANARWYRKRPVYILLLLLGTMIAIIVTYNSFTKVEKVDTIIRSNFQTNEQPKNNLEQNDIGNSNLIQEKINRQEQNVPIPSKPENETTLTNTEKRDLVRKAQQSLHGELKR